MKVRPIRYHREPPDRFSRPGAVPFTISVLALAFVICSFSNTGLSIERMAGGIPGIGRVIAQMFPPDLTRIQPIAWTLAMTFQMAVAGTVLGLGLALPIAVLASNGLSPHPLVRAATRAFVAFLRTVPDLVWALIFVVAVGLGPPAGVLTIMVDTIGYAGRFFAEAMEESDKGSQEALQTIGASRTGIIFSSVVPNSMPSFIATALYCLEKATRSSVILGLVGAGGIGVELKVAFDLFEYQTASTIILSIFALVVVVEQFNDWLRARIIRPTS